MIPILYIVQVWNGKVWHSWSEYEDRSRAWRSYLRVSDRGTFSKVRMLLVRTENIYQEDCKAFSI